MSKESEEENTFVEPGTLFRGVLTHAVRRRSGSRARAAGDCRTPLFDSAARSFGQTHPRSRPVPGHGTAPQPGPTASAHRRAGARLPAPRPAAPDRAPPEGQGRPRVPPEVSPWLPDRAGSSRPARPPTRAAHRPAPWACAPPGTATFPLARSPSAVPSPAKRRSARRRVSTGPRATGLASVPSSLASARPRRTPSSRTSCNTSRRPVYACRRSPATASSTGSHGALAPSTCSRQAATSGSRRLRASSHPPPSATTRSAMARQRPQAPSSASTHCMAHPPAPLPSVADRIGLPWAPAQDSFGGQRCPPRVHPAVLHSLSGGAAPAAAPPPLPPVVPLLPPAWPPAAAPAPSPSPERCPAVPRSPHR